MWRTLPLLSIILPLLICATSCREDELVVPTEYDIVPETPDPDTRVRGFYLVNEGNMGSNKCTLDYFDYFTGLYARNFYAERNPNVIKELGDVGNDIGIYGSKLYVVVNCSHKVEVMDARSGVRLGQIDIPNCRYIRFHRGNAYVSSYVGPVLIDPNAPKGAVYKIDTLAMRVTDKVTVGYQPEKMEIVDDYMYVANSGGYRAPNYDNTVSVIQMVDFKQVQQIPVGINLHRLKKDRYDIPTGRFSLLIDLSLEEGNWNLYGCSMRIHPESDEIYMSVFHQFQDPTYSARRYSSAGVLLKEYPMISNYWFPSLPVFPQDDPLAGIEAPAVNRGEGIAVEINGGMITVVGAEGLPVTVHTLAGIPVGVETASSGRYTLALRPAPGVYIISCGGIHRKIAL